MHDCQVRKILKCPCSPRKHVSANSSAWAGEARQVLASVIGPPPRKSWLLFTISSHLVSANGSELTPLGQHLARIPLDPQIGKMLVFGALVRCTEDVLTIAAALCSRSPFSPH